MTPATVGQTVRHWAGAFALLLVVTLSIGCRTTSPVRTADIEPPEDLNKRALITLIGSNELPPPQRVVERLATHQSIQALIQVPSAGEAGGPLLDPARLVVELDGVPLETYLLYRNPMVALLFAVVAHDITTTPSELTMTASFRGEKEMAAGWRLPLEPTAEQMARILTPPEREGRTIVIVDTEGRPVPKARVFGQRREDLFALADADGAVVLDAPTRSSFETHFAWAPGTWLTRFDAIRDPEPVLIPRRGTERTQRVRLNLRNPEGSPLQEAWLLVNDLDWVYYRTGRSVRLKLRKDQRNLLNIVAAGYQVKPLEFTGRLTETTITLEPLVFTKAQ